MKSIIDYINEAKIEYKEFRGEIIELKRLKNSPNGNPSWKISMKNEKGAEISGRTAPNIQLSYWLSENKLGQTMTLKYHYTTAGKLYFDAKVDDKKVKESKSELSDEDHLDIAHKFDVDYDTEECEYVGEKDSLKKVKEYLKDNYGFFGHKIESLAKSGDVYKMKL